MGVIHKLFSSFIFPLVLFLESEQIITWSIILLHLYFMNTRKGVLFSSKRVLIFSTLRCLASSSLIPVRTHTHTEVRVHTCTHSSTHTHSECGSTFTKHKGMPLMATYGFWKPVVELTYRLTSVHTPRPQQPFKHSQKNLLLWLLSSSNA